MRKRKTVKQCGKAEYHAAIAHMREKALEWAKANPTKEATIQWRIPTNAVIMGSISDGLCFGLVKPNPDGLEMLEFMFEQMEHEPSIVMVRMALDESYDPFQEKDNQ